MTIAFFVEDTPVDLMQAWNLCCSLEVSGILGRSAGSCIMAHAPGIDGRKLSTFEAIGVKLVEVPDRNDPGRMPWLHLLSIVRPHHAPKRDQLLLLEPNVLITAAIDDQLNEGAVSGHRAGDARFPEQVYKVLREDKATEEPVSRTKLDQNSLGSGALLLDGLAIPALVPVWSRWTAWVGANASTCVNDLAHLDRVALALALTETGLEASELATEHFLDLHSKSSATSARSKRLPTLIACGDALDRFGLPERSGVARIDNQLKALSEAIVERRRARFNNPIFWDFRYFKHSELGSGKGSRGDVLRYKRERLAPVFEYCADLPVVDLGCGDLETTRVAPFTHYLGLDVSTNAIETAHRKRPDWSFSLQPLSDFGDGAFALAICLDVLIHQDQTVSIKEIIEELVRVASDLVVLSGYTTPPEASGIVFQHPSILDVLKGHPDVQSTVILGQYHGVDLILAQKASGQVSRLEIDMINSMMRALKSPAKN